LYAYNWNGIREMPIIQKTAPGAVVRGRAVALNDSHFAVATSANRFMIIKAAALGSGTDIGGASLSRFQMAEPASTTTVVLADSYGWNSSWADPTGMRSSGNRSIRPSGD
jgi:hypothetical protein